MRGLWIEPLKVNIMANGGIRAAPESVDDQSRSQIRRGGDRKGALQDARPVEIVL